MIKRLVNPFKAFRTLRKTPTILTTILRDVTQEQAATLRDGPDGWSVLFIVCHLRDLEKLYIQRIHDLLARPEPAFAVVSNDELAIQNNYAGQNLRQVLDEFLALRREFIALLETLTDDQWLLTGVHPDQGPATTLDVAVNTGLHDVDHIEQIIRCLEPLQA